MVTEQSRGLGSRGEVMTDLFRSFCFCVAMCLVCLLAVGMFKPAHAQSAIDSFYGTKKGIDKSKLPKGAEVTERQYYRENDGSFFDEKQRGYFWYENQVNEQTVTLPPEPPKGGGVPVPEQKAEAQGSGAGGPTPLSTEWLRKNLEKYLDAAIDDPSVENVSAYLYLQRLAMDRSSNFTKTFSQVTRVDPYLNENNVRPQITLAKNARDDVAKKAGQEAMSFLVKRSSLVFFIRGDCQYCHVQSPIMKLMERQVGFNIQPVSLDGRGIKGYEKPLVNQGQAEMLGVSVTPTIFLYSKEAQDKGLSTLGPNGQMLPPGFIFIAQGVIGFEDLKGMVIAQAGEAGFLSQKIIREFQGFDDRFITPESLKKVQKEELERIVTDPQKLTQFLRERVKEVQ